MMYPRLKLARNLLTDDGVIFISIDDNEVANLRKVCDEIFGEENFVADLIWTNKEGGGSSDSKLFRLKHEHILCYSKLIELVEIIGIPVSNAERYKSEDEHVSTRGRYYLQKMGMGSIQYSESLDYPIEAPDGTFIKPADNNNGRKACWRWSKPKYKWGVENGFIVINKDREGIWTVYSKQYLNCDNDGNLILRTQRPMGVIDQFSSTQASKLLYSLDLGSYFNYSKPIELIEYLIERLPSNNLILDFFSGSATTAHAVMQLNAEDGGNRKYICIQIPEPTPEDSEAHKSGYNTIPDIAKERIRRSGQKILEEQKEKAEKEGDLFAEESAKLDIGFKVFKLDSSNINAWDSDPDNLETALHHSLFNIKTDRSEDDLLFEILIKYGIELTEKINRHSIAGKTVYEIGAGSLIVCLVDNLTTDVAEGIGKLYKEVSPDGVDGNCRVVFKDSGFGGSDEVKTNTILILKQHDILNVASV